MNVDIYDVRQWLDNARPWVHLLLIWSLAWLALWMIRRLLRGLKTHIVSRVDARADARRIATLMNVFRYTSNVVIIGLAIMLTLGVIGISVTPLLATAGVAGIAIGFGAQSLVKDFFSGLFLLIENQVSEGDLIEAAGKSGYVERVTLRHIRIRDVDGSVHFIPNGMITTVTNRSRGYAYAVIEFNVKRQENLERVFTLMRETASTMRADPVLGPDILDDIEIDGVEKIEDATVALRCRLRVKAGRQAHLRREFLSRMKTVLDHVDEMESAA
jgi:moderate conductance mechanosensitive channel